MKINKDILLDLLIEKRSNFFKNIPYDTIDLYYDVNKPNISVRLYFRCNNYNIDYSVDNVSMGEYRDYKLKKVLD